jgi:hypothetical protein
MSLFEIILSVFALVIFLPLTASWLMNIILDNTDDDGIYDDEDA